MEERDFLELLSERNQIQAIVEMNQKTERFGLMLTEEDAKMLAESRKTELREQRRVEFGEGILPKLIFTFCDSPYIAQEDYVDTIARLQEIFYLYKNESMDELTDDELLEFMENAFNGECKGELEYLEGTVLEAFARNIRSEGKSFFKGVRGDVQRGYADDEL